MGIHTGEILQKEVPMASNTDPIVALPSDDNRAHVTATALLYEQFRELQREKYVDLPPADSLLPIALSRVPSPVSPEDVDHLSSVIKGQWEDFPVPALLVSAYLHSESGDKFAGIVAKVIHMSLMLGRMGSEYHDEVVLVCRRARHLLTREKALLDHLPEFHQSFQQIAEGLSALLEDPPAPVESHTKRLEEWNRCVTTILDGRMKHQRHTFGADITAGGEVIEHPLPDFDDSALAVSEAPCTVPFPNSPEEARDDQPKAGQDVRTQLPATSEDRSRGIAWNQGKEMINRLHMLSSGAPCLGSRLTASQVRRAFEICYEKLNDSPAHLLVALVILTGRRADRLVSLEVPRGRSRSDPGECWLTQPDGVYLRYQPELPEHKPVTRLPGIQRTSDNSIRTPLPPRVGEALLNLYRSGDQPINNIDIGPAIAELRQRIDKNISAVRLCNALEYELSNNGVDEVLIAWLTGGSPKHYAGMYYTLVARRTAAEAYADVVNDLMDVVGATDRLPIPEDDSYVGTRVRINPKFITESFQRQANQLSEALRKREATCPFSFHNRYVLYVAQLLSLTTLIRSVTAPFGGQSDINLLASTVRIADKANRQSDASRLVALGHTGTSQLQKYNDHLRSLCIEFRHYQPSVARAIQLALDGKSPHLFYFDKHRVAQAVRPKWMLAEFGNLWPFPTNWPRHSLSAWIRRQSFSKGAIRALYGHADFGPAPLSRYDGTAVRELADIADVIDDYLEQHNIGSIDGWSTGIYHP